MISERPAQTTYRADIDGLRSVAVLSVVLFHLGFGIPGGFTGVDIFFVISGFLIGGQIYSQTSQGSFSYIDFYYKRAKRIVPALLTVLFSTAFAMLLLASPLAMQEFGRDAFAAILSFSNVTLFNSIGYFRPGAETNPLLMTWSLGIEEQFYLIAPLALALLIRVHKSRRLAMMAVPVALSLLLSIWQMLQDPQAAFYLLAPRAWELGVGMMAALWRVHNGGLIERGRSAIAEVSSIVGLTLLLVPMFTYGPLTPFPGVTAIPTILGTALLLNTDKSLVNLRLLSNRVCTFFGLISYSLYLWHWPLISISRMVLEDEPSAWLRVELGALSLVLAYITYRWIETPFRRQHQAKDAAKISLRRYATVIITSAAVLGSAFAAAGFPQRWPALSSTRSSEPSAQSHCLVGYGASEPKLEGDCVSHVAGETVALVGDSHASAMSPAIRSLASSVGMGFEELTKASCPFLVDVTREMTKYPRHARECAEFNRKVMSRLLARSDIRVVVVGGFWRVGLTKDGPYASTTGRSDNELDLLKQGLLKSSSALVKSGKQVILMGDVPYFDFSPIKRAASCENRLRRAIVNATIGNHSCEYGAPADLKFNPESQETVHAVAKDSGARYFDPVQALCDSTGCRFANEQGMLYIDQQHLSVTGAKLVGERLKPLIFSP